jgi:hypothetical protein
MILQKRCTKCLMPSGYPGISFDNKGVCSYCLGLQHYGKTSDKDICIKIAHKDEVKKEFEKTLEENRGKGEYDCIINLSGGKDSTYLLYVLKTLYNLRILAYTLDNGFISPIARENISRTITGLDIDHIYVTPNAEFLKRFFRYLIVSIDNKDLEQNGYLRSICPVCSDKLILGNSLKEAAKRKIPFIIIGKGPHQITRDFYEISRNKIESSWIPEWVTPDNCFIEDDKRHFWNPDLDAEENSLPKVLFPFHVLDYPGPEKIMREVVRLGLIEKKNVSPRVTNCHINWLFQYLDRKRDYDPMVAEISYQIRTGMTDRRKSLILLELSRFVVKAGIYNNFIRRREINLVLKFLDLKIRDLT